MPFENTTQSELSPNSPSSHDDLTKKALEMEMKNTEIENTPQGQPRNEKILKLDALNEDLHQLESLTGLPEKDIMETYKELTTELAIKSIDQLLEELDKSMSQEEGNSLKQDLNNGNFEKFLTAIKTIIPKQLLLAAACSLMITTSAWAADTTSSQIEETTATDYQMAQKITSEINDSLTNENTEITDMESIAKTKQLLNEANQKALKVIEDIDGPSALSLVPSFFKKAGIKQMAQKGVIDELADNSQAMIEYLKDTTKKPPSLDNEALELFNIYSILIAKVDKFKNEKASTQVRENIETKLRLIETKDYTAIKKGMS